MCLVDKDPTDINYLIRNVFSSQCPHYEESFHHKTINHVAPCDFKGKINYRNTNFNNIKRKKALNIKGGG